MEAENLDFLRYSIQAFQKLVRSLETSKFFTEDFIDEGPYFFCILNEDLTILKLNKCGADVLGINYLEAVGKNLNLSGLTNSAFTLMSEKLFGVFTHEEHAASDTFEIEIFQQDKSTKYFNFQAQKIGKSLKLEANLILLVGTDVSHIKSLMNEKLRNQQLEYAQTILENQLVTTTNIQKMLIPPAPKISKSNVGVRVFYRPSEYCSGDFWWAKDHEDRYILILCDVMGHGVASGMLGSFINGYIQCYFANEPAVSNDIVFKIGQKITELTQNEYTATFSAVQIDHDMVTLWNAGGVPPIIVDKNDQISRVKMPSGIMGLSDLSIQSHTITRNQIKRIMWHTDGFGDFRDEKSMMYNKKKLSKFIDEIALKPIDQAYLELDEEINRISKEYTLVDDITFTILDP